MKTEIEHGQELANSAEGQEDSLHEHHGKDRLVTVSIDGVEKQILAGTYKVPQLKEALGVPLDYELDLVRGGKFEPLPDDQTYKVHGHEEFLSHVRCGGSSQ